MFTGLNFGPLAQILGGFAEVIGEQHQLAPRVTATVTETRVQFVLNLGSDLGPDGVTTTRTSKEEVSFDAPKWGADLRELGKLTAERLVAAATKLGVFRPLPAGFKVVPVVDWDTSKFGLDTPEAGRAFVVVPDTKGTEAFVFITSRDVEVKCGGQSSKATSWGETPGEAIEIWWDEQDAKS